MRVLVTGSSGRVGRAVCLELSRHCQVRGLDLSPSSSTELVGDYCDRDLLRRALDGIDAVVHIAALHAPHVPYCSEAEFQRVNVDGSWHLLDLAAQAGVNRLVFTSTTALYGGASKLADRAAWLDEESIPQPLTAYHHSKLAAEELLVDAATKGGPSVRILRMSRCFPEAADLMAVYRLHRGVDVRDVASAHALALKPGGPACAKYIISAATPFLVEDCQELKHDARAVLAHRAPALAAIFDRRSWPLPESIDRVYDSSLAQQELGWQPLHGYESVLSCYDEGDAEVLLPSAWSNR